MNIFRSPRKIGGIPNERSEMYRLVGNLARRYLAISLAFCLASASIGPSVAIACEGAAEEQKISVTPVGGSNACKANGAGEVEFSEIGEWCEYRIKNENKKEAVTIRAGEKNRPEKSECAAIGCFEFRKPVIPHKECVTPPKPTELAVGEECYNSLEYHNRPKVVPVTTGFDVITKSTNGGLGGGEVLQRILK